MSGIRTNHANDEFERGIVIFIDGVAKTIDYVDDYDHHDSSVKYILENCPFKPTVMSSSEREEYKHIADLQDSIYERGCKCSEKMCCSKEICMHGGNYKVATNANGGKELVLSESRSCRDLIYECWDKCDCNAICINKLVQYGPRKNLEVVEVIYNQIKQKGLITTRPILKGAFICEYVGEILTKNEACRRNLKNIADTAMNYIICLNEHSLESSARKIQTFIDPSEKGNIGRYLNHSCDPNCEILSVRVGSPLPHLGIFAKRDISENEELCFHYGGECSNNVGGEFAQAQCFCGFEKCEKYLPGFSFQ